MTSNYGNGGGGFSELPSPKKTNRKRKQLFADVALVLIILALIVATVGAPIWIYFITAGAILVAAVVRFFLH